MDIFTDVHSKVQFCMKTGNPCADYILEHGIYEYNLIKWCEQYLNPESTFVDIGAHMGTYTVLLGKKCREVHAFEAQKSTFDCLSVSICINNGYNTCAHNVALGSCDTEMVLHHVSEDGGCSTVRPEVLNSAGLGIISSETVKVTTLDSFNIKNIDFMKIDVEGYELEVIKGASMTLMDNNFPPFIFEAWPHDWYKDDRELLLSHVRALGYKVYPISGTNNMYLASDHPLREKKESKEEPCESSNNINELCKKYESKEFDDMTWDMWHKLANHYRNISKHQIAYDCAKRGLEASPPVENEYKLYEEIAIVAYYIDKKREGYEACEKIVLSAAPWPTRNYTLNNQAFYMNKIPFKKIITLTHDLPEGYINSSCSLIPDGDGFRLNMRCVNYSHNDKGYCVPRDPEGVVRTRNFLLTLDKTLNTQASVELIDVSGIATYPVIVRGFEDIRLFGTNELFSTNLDFNESRIPQMCYCRYDPIEGEITDVKIMSTTEQLQCEKNWVPFVMNDEVHFIYTAGPFRLYKLDRDTGETQLVKETSLCDQNLQDFRGSSSLIPYKNGWLGIIHQVYYSEPRKYFHRFVWYDSEFTTIKYSNLFYFESIGIEYSLSLCHSDNGLLITYSQKDNNSKIGTLNYEILESWLSL